MARSNRRGSEAIWPVRRAAESERVVTSSNERVRPDTDGASERVSERNDGLEATRSPCRGNNAFLPIYLLRSALWAIAPHLVTYSDTLWPRYLGRTPLPLALPFLCLLRRREGITRDAPAVWHKPFVKAPEGRAPQAGLVTLTDRRWSSALVFITDSVIPLAPHSYSSRRRSSSRFGHSSPRHCRHAADAGGKLTAGASYAPRKMSSRIRTEDDWYCW